MEQKFLYFYRYCSDGLYEQDGGKAYHILVTPCKVLEEIEDALHNKFYRVKFWGSIPEFKIGQEKIILFGNVNDADNYCAEWWSFSDTEEDMNWFKSRVGSLLEDALKELEQKANKIKNFIEEIKN